MAWALSWICKIKLKLGIAVLPRMGADRTGTAMTAHLHSAFASTAHPEEAWEWVRFLYALLSDAVLQDRVVVAQPDRTDDRGRTQELDHRRRTSGRVCRYSDQVRQELRTKYLPTSRLAGSKPGFSRRGLKKYGSATPRLNRRWLKLCRQPMRFLMSKQAKRKT